MTYLDCSVNELIRLLAGRAETHLDGRAALVKRREGGTAVYGVTLDRTEILTFWPRGEVRVHPDGWLTPLTRRYLRKYAPFEVRQTGGWWLVAGHRVWHPGTRPPRYYDRRRDDRSAFWVAGRTWDLGEARRDSRVRALARGIAAGRAWDANPLLADALQEAGLCETHPALAFLRRVGEANSLVLDCLQKHG